MTDARPRGRFITYPAEKENTEPIRGQDRRWNSAGPAMTSLVGVEPGVTLPSIVEWSISNGNAFETTGLGPS